MTHQSVSAELRCPSSFFIRVDWHPFAVELNGSGEATTKVGPYKTARGRPLAAYRRVIAVKDSLFFRLLDSRQFA